MSIRDHRTKAKQWSYGRAQLASPAGAGKPWNKARTRLTKQRINAAERAASKDKGKA